ncbi:type II secretion system protein GspM [Desulfurivibrio sp. D14AmB]|uniref:type II secretion system protein GspM n=1 Tax=Desulfurivibrio sp. D14AmB TaxID=3374370 RepID=UPI00376EF5DE
MISDLRLRFASQLEALLADIPPRQRPLLMVGLGLLGLLLIWLLLLSPLNASRATLAREIAAKEQELLWMRAAAAEVRQFQSATAGVGGGGGGSPLAVIDTSARQLGLGQAMQRVEPVGGREVRVWLENAVFDDLLRWLVQLEAGHGIQVAEIVVEPGRTASGLVNARLTLMRD